VGAPMCVWKHWRLRIKNALTATERRVRNFGHEISVYFIKLKGKTFLCEDLAGEFCGHDKFLYTFVPRLYHDRTTFVPCLYHMKFLMEISLNPDFRLIYAYFKINFFEPRFLLNICLF